MDKQAHRQFCHSIYKNPNEGIIEELWQLKLLELELTGRLPSNQLTTAHYIINSWATGDVTDGLTEIVDHDIKKVLGMCLCETLNFVRPIAHTIELNPYYELLIADPYLMMDNLEHCVEVINLDTKMAYKFVKTHGPTSMDHYMPFKAWVDSGWQAVLNPTTELPGLLLDNKWLLGYAQSPDKYKYMELINGTPV